MARRAEKNFAVSDLTELQLLLGPSDRHLRCIREHLDVQILHRGQGLKVLGPPREVDQTVRVLDRLLRIVRSQGLLEKEDVEGSLASEGIPVSSRSDGRLHAGSPAPDSGPRALIELSQRGRGFSPMTEGQRRYVRTIGENDIVFSIGPAGTGKTYVAVAVGLECLRQGKVRRLVLARPAVEAGERLGFLPGDPQAKVHPYLQPIYDCLNSLLDFGYFHRLLQTDIIEIIPLAYMRGRTLDDAFIILDEAQNTTSEQMKMFLTRMGNGSKIVVTGDITQIDLPPGKMSGLVHVQKLLRDIPSVGFSYLTRADIVRHPLVQEIVDAYESQRK